MAAKIGFNFVHSDDNLKNIKDLHPALQKTIKNIAEKEGYINYVVVKRNFSSHGGNFLGELSEIDIKGMTAEGEKEINLFIKKQVDIKKIKMINLNDIYLKELFVYTELSNVIKFLQEKFEVPSEDRFKMANAYDESNTDILIFENLAKKGFKTYGRLHFPSLKYIELAIQDLAKFHGISFVIEHTMPEFHNNKIKSICNSYTFDDDFKALLKKAFLTTANLFDDEIKKKIQDLIPIATKKYPMYDKDQTTIKCALCHSDYRTSNVLVREMDGEPIEVVIVDFQLVNYGCPIRDFLFFVFSCTSREFRKQHLKNLKELYFSTLRRYLKYFDLDVEHVYPRKEFEEVYKEWLDFGLIKMLYASVFLFAPETGLDVGNLTLAELPFNPDQDFAERARGWIEDYLEWGYL